MARQTGRTTRRAERGRIAIGEQPDLHILTKCQDVRERLAKEGVEYGDKSVSYVAAATARRATSSLGHSDSIVRVRLAAWGTVSMKYVMQILPNYSEWLDS
jgi:hypothetical protein